MSYDYKAPVLEPHEVAFPKPTPEPMSSRTKAQAVKALRDKYPSMGLKEAVDIVEGKKPRPDEPDRSAPIVLSDAELKAAKSAIRQVHANFDVKLQAVIDAINHVRTNDPVGTLRKNTNGQYAFCYEPGKWLVIDPDKPAYRAADGLSESAAIRSTWELVVLG
ncbi:hypothetical protein SEA_ENCELADUS_84 [Mycobacterium phage Enceladus]|uniref:Uncharacterized protein n=1 Tax=Mycobacterium phage OhShagHennessy TaxID=2801895 RepID=A0A7U0J7C9_9CAUD|nr:hypothetical protein KNV76_gp083 [Mycobacterium phage OhShagHennessy]ASR86069.1 hypothetical protein SEA_APPLETREE2_86 [Mycobacterium phage Appletree2]QQV92786.1 hypothetical protein SEA_OHSHAGHENNESSY_83 [Mycobacterium phage OhShagHennessy]UEM46370.1 hypothetical protein SEA_ENCELADUS_84 [Mycobacterium phage Enceladus]